MKKIIFSAIALSTVLTAAASSVRVLRSEFVPYNTREAALSRDMSAVMNYMEVEPAVVSQRRDAVIYMQGFDADAASGDCNTYLHIENAGSAYTLLLNGKLLAEVEDERSPADFLLNDALVQGRNTLTLELRRSRTPQISNGTPAAAARPFEGSRIFCQRKLRIDDYSARIVPDESGSHGILMLDIAVANGFGGEETFAVGYDITSPSGKLLDYTVQEMTLAGNSRDTLRITTPIYDAPKYKWGENRGEAPLYSVMLYIKRNGKPEQYIPLNTAFGGAVLDGDRIMNNGRETEFLPHRYSSQPDAGAARREIARLKKEGINTVVTDFPQPSWFYDECDRAGMYVIDRAAIYAQEDRTVRGRGGTPSNDPALLAEYLSRMDAMYFRMRNHPCIAGFMLGGEAGNGYNMYKAYQYLKSLETSRPVIYEDARGEWNTDL